MPSDHDPTAPPGPFAGLPARGFLLLCVLVSLATAIVFRVPRFLGTDFPLNDGALFVEMARAVGENGFLPPAAVSFNGREIPFAYPPLGFIVAAAIAVLGRFDLVDVARWLPLALNLAAVALAPLLAWRFLAPARTAVFLSCLVFPALPKSYEWIIMGGGLTRSIGFLFALASLLALFRVLEGARRKAWSLGLVASIALTCLSHLEWGITAVVAAALVSVWKLGPRIRPLASVGLLVAAGGLLSFAWYGVVLQRHGLDPFLAASTTAEWTGLRLPAVSHWPRNLGLRGGMPLVGFAALGIAWSVLSGRWILPAWVAAIFVTTPRHGPSAASFPLALLAAWVLGAGLDALIARLPPRTRAPLFRYTLMAVLSFGLVGYLSTRTRRGEAIHTPLRALTAEERALMEWVGKSLPGGSRIIVLSDALSWQDDRYAEWFPLLAGRESLTTPQGLEWIPGGDFHRSVAKVRRLKDLQRDPTAGSRKTLPNIFGRFDYVVDFRSAPRSFFHLRDEFLPADDYVVVHRGGGGVVYAWQEPDCIEEVCYPRRMFATTDRDTPLGP